MNTDREYCRGTDCPKREECRRYVEYKIQSCTFNLWMCEPIACRESGYSHFEEIKKKEGKNEKANIHQQIETIDNILNYKHLKIKEL